MRQARARIGTEAVALALILGCLGASLAAIVGVYRREATRRTSVVLTPITGRPAPKPQRAEGPPLRPDPPRPDPTSENAKTLAAQALEEGSGAARADRIASSRERAIRAAIAEAERWKSREALIRARVAAREQDARRREAEADALAALRDVLARKRDEARAELARARARARDGVAVLPYKGPSGTWQRPIAVECAGGLASIQPGGPSFRLIELSGGFGGRSHPFVAAVARAAARALRAPSPDGDPVAPYVFFVVRPDGIRPYYEARARVDAAGFHFGYELVDQDTAIDFLDPAEPDIAVGSGAGTPAEPPRSPGGAGTSPPLADGPISRGTSGRLGGDLAGLDEVGGRGNPSPLGPEADSVRFPGTGPRGPGRWREPVPSRPSLPAAGREVGPGAIGTSSPFPPRRGDDPFTLSGVGRPSSPLPPRRVGEGRGGGPAGAVVPPPRPSPIPPSGDGRISEPNERIDPPVAGESAGIGSGRDGGPLRMPDAFLPDGGRGPAATGADGPTERLLGEIRPARPLVFSLTCGPRGVAIEPGAYRLSLNRLGDPDGPLVRRLRAIVEARSLADPQIRWQPRVAFLVEPGGGPAYWAARKQLDVSGPGWPMSLRVSEAESLQALWRGW